VSPICVNHNCAHRPTRQISSGSGSRIISGYQQVPMLPVLAHLGDRRIHARHCQLAPKVDKLLGKLLGRRWLAGLAGLVGMVWLL